MAFNVPFSDKVVTGSFDKTAKLWDVKTAKLLNTFVGHEGEIVSVSFDPHGYFIATGSMDYTARLWDIETGKIHSVLKGH
jgi:dynein assembly factor with WDR repeat domains 1